MAGGVFSGALLNGMTIRESATDGSDFSNPSADYRRLFLGEDGQLHVKDSAGAVTDIGAGSGNVATDAIWDAAGDLAVGTGANTAAKLTLGAAGTVPRSSGSALAYAYPPGYEFAYAESTGSVNITGTDEAGANTIVTAGAVTGDGATVMLIEFFTPEWYLDAADRQLTFVLYDGSSAIGLMGRMFGGGLATNARGFVHLAHRLTPTSASHTYSIRAFANAATPILTGGAGGAGTLVPQFIRITKV